MSTGMILAATPDTRAIFANAPSDRPQVRRSAFMKRACSLPPPCLAQGEEALRRSLERFRRDLPFQGAELRLFGRGAFRPDRIQFEKERGQDARTQGCADGLIIQCDAKAVGNIGLRIEPRVAQ